MDETQPNTPPAAPPPDSVVDAPVADADRVPGAPPPDSVVDGPAPTAGSAVTAPPPDSVVAAPVTAETPAYQPDPNQEGGLFSRGGSALLNDADVSRIAAASGADPDYIRSAAPWLGLAAPSATQSEGERFGSLVKATAGQYVPDLGVDLFKKLAVDDPAKRRALDALEAEAHSRRSYAQAFEAQLPAAMATEGIGAAASVATRGVGTAAELAPKAIAAAQKVTQTFTLIGTGAGQGALEAPEGHEVAGAVMGGLAAVGFHALASGAGVVADRVRAEATAALQEFLIPRSAVDAATEAFESNSDAETALSNVVRGFNPDAKPNLSAFVANTSAEDRQLLASLTRDPPSTSVDPIAHEMDVELESGGDVAPTDSDKRAYSVYSDTRAGLGRTLGVRGDNDWSGAFERAGDDYVADRLAAYRMGTHLRDAIGDSPEVKSLGDVGWIRRAWMAVADSRYVYDSFDQRFGTEFGPMLSKGSQLYGAYTQAAAPSAVAIRDVSRAIMAAEGKTRGGADWLPAFDSAMRAGEFPETEFTPKQVTALRAARDYAAWDRERLMADSRAGKFDITPIDIPENVVGSERSYWPEYGREYAEAIGLTRGRMETATNSTEVGDWRTEAERLFSDGPQTPTEAETLKGLEYHFGAPFESVQDARASADVIAGLVARTGAGTRSSAASLFQREGAIPDYLLERDPFRLMNGWATSMWRHVYLRGFISDMSNAASTLSDISPIGAKYVRNHISDLLGVRRGLSGDAAEAMDSMRIAASRAMARTENPVAKAMYKQAANADDVLRAMSANAYSFYLGLSPSSAARYAAQTVTNALPQLSPEYAADAAARVTRAYADTAAKLFARDSSNAFRELADGGYLPAARLFEAQQQARAAMSSTLIGRWNESARSAANALSMKLIQSADVIGRYSTLSLARDIAADAAEGDAAALAHISRMPAGFLSETRRALRAGDVAGAQDAYARYLIGTTQGNYDRVSMSEYGRVMGYVFSMFTKWPTMAIGELGGLADARWGAKQAVNGDVGRVLWKYVAPLFVTNYLQNQWSREYADAPAALRVAVGRDVRKWSSAESLQSGVSLPIPIEAGKGAWTAATQGNWAGLAGIVGGSAASVTPFGAYVHFATSTLPGWMGEDPLIPLTAREISQAVKD